MLGNFINKRIQKIHDLTYNELLDKKKRGFNLLFYLFIVMALVAWIINTNLLNVSKNLGTIVYCILIIICVLVSAYVGIFSLEKNRRKLLDFYREMDQIQEQCQRHNVIFDSMKKENENYLIYHQNNLVATYKNGKLYIAN